MDLFARIGRRDLDKGLDTPLEVPVQQVAGADKHALVLALAEAVDARMLKPAPDHAFDHDVLGLARNPRPQAADAADEQLDLHAGLRALDELFHDLGAVHGVDLHPDPSRRPLGDLAVQVFDHPAFEAQRRNPEGIGLGGQLALLQGLEGRLGVPGRIRVRGDQGEVGILLAGDLVIVARADLGDVAEVPLVLAGDEAELGVHLVVRQAVDDAAAGVLEHLGIVDVVLLVKARTQLEQAEHILSSVGRIGQGRGDLAAGRHAVEGDLDAQNLGVVRRLVNQVHKGQHALEGIAHQQVVPVDVAEVLALLQADLARGLPLVIAEVVVAAHRAAEGQVKGDVHRKDHPFRYVQLLDEQRTGGIAELAVDLGAHGGLALALGEHGRGLLPQILLVRDLGEEDVGVSRDLHHSRLQNLLLLQQQGQEAPDQLIRQDDFLAAVDFKAQVRRHTVHGDDRHLLRAAAAEEGDDVALLPPEEGEGLVEADDLREEQVADIPEQLFAHQLVDLADLVEGQHLDAAVPQLGADGLPDALREALLLPRDAQDLFHKLVGQHAGERVPLVRLEHEAVRQDADADPVKLLQIRLVDHQELEPLQQRHGHVRRLEQDALVKAQPADLAVDVDTVCFFLFVHGISNSLLLFCPTLAFCNCAEVELIPRLQVSPPRILLYRKSSPKNIRGRRD